MEQDSNGSFQSLGNGTFRAGGVRVNPTTGRYITAKEESSLTASARPPQQESSHRK